MRKVSIPATLLAPALLLCGAPSQAATWRLDPAESHVYFFYHYEGERFRGEFKRVEATFEFDAANPGDCRFSVVTHVKELDTGYDESNDTLLDREMLDVDRWPTSTFEVTDCAEVSAGAYAGTGMLTIRDQTNRESFPFGIEITETSGGARFHMTSDITILRLSYGVGQGFWARTDQIPNDVQITVDVYANRE